VGLFGNNNKPKEEPLFKNSYLGFWVKVYNNRVEFKSGVGSKSIPINEIASIQVPMMGMWNITLETTGGKKYSIPTNKKKEVQKAIYDAQASLAGGITTKTTSADEIAKYNDLKEKGVITKEEFEQKKKQLLGL
jgi:hypothetical protein